MVRDSDCFWFNFSLADVLFWRNMTSMIIIFLFHLGLITLGFLIGKIYFRIPVFKELQEFRKLSKEYEKKIDEVMELSKKYYMAIRKHQETIDDLEAAKEYYYNIEKN